MSLYAVKPSHHRSRTLRQEVKRSTICIVRPCLITAPPAKQGMFDHVTEYHSLDALKALAPCSELRVLTVTHAAMESENGSDESDPEALEGAEIEQKTVNNEL